MASCAPTPLFLSLIPRFSKGALVRADSAGVQRIEVISTGSIKLDAALGVGGLPKGHVVEIFGPESSGKTTLALHLMASCQRNGGAGAFLDAEHALDASYAARLGVDLEAMVYGSPACGEEALEMARLLLESRAVDLIAVDSVAALVPKAELAGGEELQSKLLDSRLSRLSGLARRTGACLLFLNQIRMAGGREVSPGGPALKLQAAVRARVETVGYLEGMGTRAGRRIQVEVKKNRLAGVQRVELELWFERGIEREQELLEVGMGEGLIAGAASGYSFEGRRMEPGREEVWNDLDRALRMRLGLLLERTG
jgi:recombination protein RecA